MNWDAIAAIAEVVGAISVVVTLAYLATQIRQNTQSNRNVTLQTIHTQNSDWLSALVDADIARLFRTGQQNSKEITA